MAKLVSSFPMDVMLVFLRSPQNFTMALWISLHKLLGSLEVLIVYACTTWATALMRISLHPLENILCCQLYILLRTLSLTSLKKLVFFLPIMDGRLRYFSCLDTTLSLKVSLIVVIRSFWIWPLNNIDDF